MSAEKAQIDQTRLDIKKLREHILGQQEQIQKAKQEQEKSQILQLTNAAQHFSLLRQEVNYLRSQSEQHLRPISPIQSMFSIAAQSPLAQSTNEQVTECVAQTSELFKDENNSLIQLLQEETRKLKNLQAQRAKLQKRVKELHGQVGVAK